MKEDITGQGVTKGDKVLVLMEVLDIQDSDNETNCSLKAVNDNERPQSYLPTMTINSRLVRIHEKVKVATDNPPPQESAKSMFSGSTPNAPPATPAATVVPVEPIKPALPLLLLGLLLAGSLSASLGCQANRPTARINSYDIVPVTYHGMSGDQITKIAAGVKANAAVNVDTQPKLNGPVDNGPPAKEGDKADSTVRDAKLSPPAPFSSARPESQRSTGAHDEGRLDLIDANISLLQSKIFRLEQYVGVAGFGSDSPVQRKPMDNAGPPRKSEKQAWNYDDSYTEGPYRYGVFNGRLGGACANGECGVPIPGKRIVKFILRR